MSNSSKATVATLIMAAAIASEAAATVRLDHDPDPDAGTHVIDGVVQPLPETTDNDQEAT